MTSIDNLYVEFLVNSQYNMCVCVPNSITKEVMIDGKDSLRYRRREKIF